jgi:glycolate oxidase iron-sulfur subunit
MASFAAVVGPAGAAGAEPLDAVLVTASGCGHTLKAYGRLLAEREATAGAAAAFAGQVADIQEFLERVGLSAAFQRQLSPLPHGDGRAATAEAPLQLAYHDACHLLHGQGLGEPPRALLRRIPHVRVLEASEAGVCCGSAGIYNLVQPEEAEALGQLKARDLGATGAELVVSANIGCTLQLRRHLGEGSRPLPVAHPMELLARSAGLA